MKTLDLTNDEQLTQTFAKIVISLTLGFMGLFVVVGAFLAVVLH